jgi:hypothetical protein
MLNIFEYFEDGLKEVYYEIINFPETIRLFFTKHITLKKAITLIISLFLVVIFLVLIIGFCFEIKEIVK